MMTDDLKTLPGWDELTAAGRVPPAGPEAMARARSAVQSARPRRWLVPVLAVVATAAVIATGVVVLSPDPSTPVASQPVYLQGDPNATCAAEYSPQRLKERPIAFDGTVTDVELRPVARGPVPAPKAGTVMVTFRVNEWFKGGDGPGTHVAMPVLAKAQEAGGKPYGLPFEVGSRLLIASDVSGTGPIKLSMAMTCNFSRFYDEASAREWRAAFGK